MRLAHWLSRLPRAQTLGVFVAVGLIAAALIGMVVASLLTQRAIDDRRRDRIERIIPFEEELVALETSVFRLSVNARQYALTGEEGDRLRYLATLAEFERSRAELARLAPRAGRESEATAIIDAANRAALTPAAVVDARAQGDINRAFSVQADESPATLESLAALTDDLQEELAATRTATTADVRDLEDRELLILLLSVVTAGIAASFLSWLAFHHWRLSERLSAERERIADLGTSVPGVVWEAWGRPDARNQRIDFVSDYVEQMTGYEPETWLRTPNFWLAIVHPDDRVRAAAEAAEIFESRTAGQSQFRWIAKDGRPIDVLAYSTVVRDASGAPAGMRGITFDISARVRAERRLRFTAMAGAVLLSSLDARETLESVAQLAVPDVTDVCAIHLAHESSELEQIAVAQRDPLPVAEESALRQRLAGAADANTGIRHVLASGEPEMGDVVPDALLAETARDGEQLQILRRADLRSYICVPLIARQRTFGTITMLSATSGAYEEADLSLARDVAARAAIAIDNARLHTDVERERARFASMVSSTSFGVCQVDANGHIEHVNPAAERLLVHAAETLLGKDFHSVVHPVHGDEAAACELSDVGTAGRRRMMLATEFTRGDGATFDAELNSAPIVVGDGKVTGAVMVFQDISERKRQEKMKDDFIGFASHELRSPLTTITAWRSGSRGTSPRIPSGSPRTSRRRSRRSRRARTSCAGSSSCSWTSRASTRIASTSNRRKSISSGWCGRRSRPLESVIRTRRCSSPRRRSP
jgi:PAS domain S-box-containing protein